MGDRFYGGSPYPNRCMDDYNTEREETEGEYEDEEVNDAENGEKSEELACPFCIEDFDVLGLCCHIDADHRVEVKPGVKRGRNRGSTWQYLMFRLTQIACWGEGQPAYRPRTIESSSSTEASSSRQSSNVDSLERIQPALSTERRWLGVNFYRN